MREEEAKHLCAAAAEACGGAEQLAEQILKINRVFEVEGVHPYAVAVALGLQAKSGQHATAFCALVRAGQLGAELGKEEKAKRGQA